VEGKIISIAQLPAGNDHLIEVYKTCEIHFKIITYALSRTKPVRLTYTPLCMCLGKPNATSKPNPSTHQAPIGTFGALAFGSLLSCYTRQNISQGS